MSFKDCIRSAVETGRISDKKGGEATAAFDEAYDEAIAEGMIEGEAEMHAALRAVEEITTLKAAKRWARVNEMQRAYTINERLMKSKNPARELENIMNDTELSYDTIRSIAMARMDQLLVDYKPKMGGFHIPTAGLDDIVQAAYGDVATPEAKELFESIYSSQELLRKWANRYGASIPENPNRRLAQTHDRVKVQAVPKDTWVQEHLERLDWELMRFEGKMIPTAKREEVLERVYDGIVNDGAGRGNPAQNQSPSLANRLARDRFLYYKTSDAFLYMQKKYGRGNMYEQTIGLIDHMSMEISLLKHFGPTAESMKEFTKRVGRERAAELNNARPVGKRDLVDKYDAYTRVFDGMYDLHTRKVGPADSNWMVQTLSTIRTLSVSAQLGGVFIPTVYGDLANASVARHMMGLPEIKVVRSYFRDFIPTEENTRQMIRNGVIFENGISLAFTKQRFFGGLDGPYWARRISDITYRMGLAAHATQVGRNAAGKELLGVWADYAGKSFDELPFAAFLMENGISAKDWNAFRATPLHEYGGATFLRPIDMFDVADDAKSTVAEKFQNAMQLYIRTAIPEPTLRSRRAMGEHIDPNSATGQIVRTMTSLLSFPVSIYFNQLRRIVEAPTLRNKLTLGARYMMWMTAGGALITQTKALVAGQEMYSMTGQDENGNWDAGRFSDFWGRSFVNGGSLGILGDMLFNNINLSNSRYRSSNPTTEWLKTAHKLTLDNMIDAGQTHLYNQGYLAQPGDDVQAGRDTLQFMDANIPDLWYMKLVWQRALADDMFQRSDPAGWAKYQRYLSEHEEGMWWAPGEEPTAPDLTTVR